MEVIVLSLDKAGTSKRELLVSDDTRECLACGCIVKMFFLLLIIVALTLFVISKCISDTAIDLNALGRWAVITGATDGIGKALAHAVAKRKFNVFLVSRNIDKLQATAGDIQKKYGVSTKVFQADFSDMDKTVLTALKEDLVGMDIGILINNVGTTCSHPEYFLEMEKNHENLYEDIIKVNITSAVNMTRIVLPGMVKAKKGLIINVSSMLSELPSPLHVLYGASKSFLTKFSIDLDLELRPKGVHVHVLKTGLVATKLSGANASDWFPPAVTAEDYAESALVEATKKRVSYGHISHSIQAALLKILPWSLVEKFFFSQIALRKKKTIKDCPRCNSSKQD